MKNNISYNENLKNLIRKIVVEVSSETNRIEEKIDGYKIYDYPEDRILIQNISSDDLAALKNEEEVVVLNRVFELTLTDKKKLSASFVVNNEEIEVDIPLVYNLNKSLQKNIKREKKIICNADIIYSVTLDKFSLHQPKFFILKEPKSKYIRLMGNKTLSQRIDTLIKIMGKNPENLLFHEKIIDLSRIIPLVEKKYMLVEISTKELGKTEAYRTLEFTPKTSLMTRSSMFIKGTNLETGDFFNEDIAFIADEFNRIEDKEVAMALQCYMNGDDEVGSIQALKNNPTSSVSPILLGNFSEKIDPIKIFSENINILEKTIFDHEGTFEATISRINAIPNSWGCRTFFDKMLCKENYNYNRMILKKNIPELRAMKIDTKTLCQTFNFNLESLHSSKRGQSSIRKTFSGLIKLLYPEVLEKADYSKIPMEAIIFCVTTALNLRKIVDNQLKIINPSNQDSSCQIQSVNRALKQPTQNELWTPHRRFTLENDGTIKKIALDTIGIKMNNSESNFLTNFQILNSNNGLVLIHHVNINRNYIIQINEQNFHLPPTSASLNYNYLTGENEDLGNDFQVISNYSFYQI